jgi:NAD(P)-dependent dehydrogenase (short-subunit alcohol dehydrogenase family)
LTNVSQYAILKRSFIGRVGFIENIKIFPTGIGIFFPAGFFVQVLKFFYQQNENAPVISKDKAYLKILNHMKEKPTTFPEQSQDVQPGKETEMAPKPEYIRQNYRGSGKLEGMKAIITGGDSGIGRSVAVHFAREGADVAIVYTEREKKDAEETEALVGKEGKKCLLLEGDLKHEVFCKQIIEKVVNEFGGLNILVNNAAVQFPKEDIQDLSAEKFRETFSTNIFPYHYLSRAAVEHLKPGSSIINTTSITAFRGSDHLIDYASTKGAIVSYTRSLAMMLVEKGIRVNAVAPGPIWTPLIPATFDKVKNFGQKTLMERAGQPSEVGPAYVFLASEDASYITGQTIHINGGEYISS